MRRTELLQHGGCRLTLLEPDEDGTYPIVFESTCLRCQQVVASTVYEEELESAPDAEARIDRDSLENRRVSALHQCPALEA